MAYTLKQLTMAYTAVHNGVAPDAATTATLNTFVNLGVGDAKALSQVLNSADDTTAVAVLTYQFFTGKSPSKAGLDYLLNSSVNPSDLNDPYYAPFNLENRYINFAANLGVNGEGAAAFAAKYGAMSFGDYVASIYETIIGSTYAKAAGVDVAAAVAYLVGTKDAVLATVTSAGMVTPNMTPAEIDLAVKAAMAGLVMAAAIKADIGLYAGAADNFMLALATGKAVYNTDITQTYAPHKGAGSEGAGQAIDNAPILPGAPEPPKPPEPPPEVSYSLVLTVGQDNATGDVLKDTFTATHLTFTVGDVLTGNGGGDVLTLTGATGGAYTLPSVTISGIETANLSNNGGLTANTSTWTGLTKLNVTAAGAATLTAHATTDVNATVSNLGAANATILTGHDVVLNVTDATTGNIVILGAKGDVSVTRAVTGSGNAGNITITGGADIDVTLTGNTTPSTGATRTMGTVFIDASDAATKVTVTAPTPIADNGVHGALDGPTVTVRDANYGMTQAGTITTVEVDGFGGSGLGINASALTTLKASHGTDIHIDNDDAVASPVTALDVTLDDIDGDFKDEGVYQILNITQGPDASAIDLQMAGLTTLNVDGDAGLTLTTSAGALASLDASGITSGGLTLTLNAAASAITIKGSATANNSVVTSGGLASVITYTGGSALDSVSLTAATIGGAIALGGGDDLLRLASGIGTPTATIDGEGGSRDTVMMTAADAVTASGSGTFASKIINFERLNLTNVSNQTIDVGALGFHYVIAGSGAGLTLNGMTSGDTLELSAAGAGYTVSLAANGANDVLNLRLGDSAGAGLTFANTLTIADIETLNVTTVDGRTTPTGATEILKITTGGQKVVNISGNAGVDLALGSTALTSVDASGVTKGGLIWTAGAIGGPITIKGAANGTNQINITQTTGVVTYEGGAGDDAITANSSNNAGAIIHFGGGNNQIIGYAGVITAGSGNDNVNLANGGTNIDLGDGANTYYTPNQVSNTIKAGSGNDSITVGGGTASIDVGSGDDYVAIFYLDGSNFTSITGMGADDRLDLSNVSNAGAMGAKLVGQTTLGGYLSIAGAAVAGTTNAMQWFELNGDIYIVADQNDSTSFDAGTDGLVRLVGVVGVLDVSLASVSGGGITFH
jgi:S-layer protein